MSDEKTEKELFEAAFSALDNEQIFEGKFGKPGEHFPDAEEACQLDVEVVKEVQDLRLMEDTFGAVEKRDHSKYWVPSKDSDDEAFASLLNEIEPQMAPVIALEKKVLKKQSEWERLAEASTDATIIDLRNLFESSATRELSRRLLSGEFFRVVYGGEKGFTKELLTHYLKHETFGNLKAVFAFSPTSKENDGLAIIKIM